MKVLKDINVARLKLELYFCCSMKIGYIVVIHENNSPMLLLLAEYNHYTVEKKITKMALDFAATYKVLVLGDSNVGKTCIVHRYCDERYYDTYISTIGKFTR